MKSVEKSLNSQRHGYDFSEAKSRVVEILEQTTVHHKYYQHGSIFGQVDFHPDKLKTRIASNWRNVAVSLHDVMCCYLLVRMWVKNQRALGVLADTLINNLTLRVSNKVIHPDGQVEFQFLRLYSKNCFVELSLTHSYAIATNHHFPSWLNCYKSLSIYQNSSNGVLLDSELHSTQFRVEKLQTFI